MSLWTIDPDTTNAALIAEWTKEYWGALHPYSAGGALVNSIMDEVQERIKATYRDNFERLVAVKTSTIPTTSSTSTRTQGAPQPRHETLSDPSNEGRAES